MAQTKITKAVILAAGLGTRMRPLTNETPKPLLKVWGKSLLEHNISALKKVGAREVTVNRHYLPHQITSEVNLLATKYNVDIKISDELDKLLDSGGGVAQCIRCFDAVDYEADSIIIMNTDQVFTNDNPIFLQQLINFYEHEKDIVAALLVANMEGASGYEGEGDFVFKNHLDLKNAGESNQINQVNEVNQIKSNLIERYALAKIKSKPLIFTGISIMKASLFAKRFGEFSLNEIFNQLITENRIKACLLSGLFYHVGTPQALSDVENIGT